MFLNLIRGVLVALCLLSGAAHAGETEIRKAFEDAFDEKPTSVTKTPVPGLWEVFAEGEIFYADDKGSYFIAGGNLLEIKSKKNLTRERLNKLTAINFSDLPLQQAIKQVRGKGTRVFATFEDPNCGYCKRFARDLQKLDDVTIYTFLYPILSPDSRSKSKAIWCAENRAKAWNDWMIDNVAPKGDGAKCDAAIEANVALGRKLRVNGTPAIFLANGERVTGAIPVADLEQRLKDAGTGKK